MTYHSIVNHVPALNISNMVFILLEPRLITINCTKNIHFYEIEMLSHQFAGKRLEPNILILN